MHENLLATHEALKSVRLTKWEPAHYRNRYEVWGVYLSFWNAGVWHMISVHNCDTTVQPNDVMKLIAGIDVIDDDHWGIYANGKDVPGFYASARSICMFNGTTNHWIMIARSPERNFGRLLKQKRHKTAEEIDLISYLERAKEDSRLCA
ncbi:hypothetical protein [Terracidiphilus sp.]|uniref:hypothetical protein n=1 Tax=Terracidiphilus sp. TaxID=1964191 RepID=UPI003C1F937A